MHSAKWKPFSSACCRALLRDKSKGVSSWWRIWQMFMKKRLSQAHQKHTLGAEKKNLCPWTANSWEGLGVAWRLASCPLPSSVQMGEVRLRLAATHSIHPCFSPQTPPPLPKLPIPIKDRLKIAEEGKEGRKAKEHDCSVFHPPTLPPSSA